MAKQIRQSSRNQANKKRTNKNNKFRSVKAQNVRGRGRVKAKGVIKKQISKAKIQDARQKIIQKKRTTVLDARDVLAKMAKGQDARSKIDKIRNNRSGVKNVGANVKVIGSSILRKTDRNGKISLVTNKSNKNASDINLAIKKQLGLVASPSRATIKKSPPKRPVAASQVVKAPLAIRKTIVNDFDYATIANPLGRIYEPGMYRWAKPDLRTASNMINSLETTRQAMRDVMREELLATSRWPEYVSPKPTRVQSTAYIDLDAVDDEEMPLVTGPPSRIALQGSTRMSNVHSRLDRLPSTPDSHGILSQTKTKVVVPAGHRIVVSNLQNTVTQDDIKELFEDIGQLLAARLVRSGVAEVIYRNLKDAQKAVDTYHNRQLDGQPMKCLLVNKRPSNQPTALPLNKESILSARKSTVSNTAAKLVPDINTIHKVLFQRK